MADISFKGTVAAVNDIRFNQQGDAMLTLRVAENHAKQVNGQWEETGTTWRDVAVLGRKAEALAEHLTKGQQVVVMGKEETRTWQKQDGTQAESLSVIASWVGLIPRNNTQPHQGGYQRQATSQHQPTQQGGPGYGAEPAF